MNTLTSIRSEIQRTLCKVSVVSGSFIHKSANHILLTFGAILLVGGLLDFSHAASQSFADPDFNDELIRNSVGNLFGLIEGAFGALIMVVAGLGAIVAAAMGAYRLAVSMLVVAVGAFILRALVSLFFGQDFEGTGGILSEGGGNTQL
jgi:hypothetical protein